MHTRGCIFKISTYPTLILLALVKRVPCVHGRLKHPHKATMQQRRRSFWAILRGWWEGAYESELHHKVITRLKANINECNQKAIDLTLASAVCFAVVLWHNTPLWPLIFAALVTICQFSCQRINRWLCACNSSRPAQSQYQRVQRKGNRCCARELVMYNIGVHYVKLCITI